MTDHAGTSFPKPGEMLGIILPGGSPLYCQVQGNGDYYVINGNWTLDPNNPIDNCKGFQIILRDMPDIDWNCGCKMIDDEYLLIQERKQNEMVPMEGAEEVLISLLSDQHSVDILTQEIYRYNSGLISKTEFKAAIIIRVNRYFKSEIKQPIPEYNIVSLFDMIKEHFENEEAEDIARRKESQGHNVASSTLLDINAKIFANAGYVSVIRKAFKDNDTTLKRVPSAFFGRSSYLVNLMYNRDYFNKEQRREIAQWLWDNHWDFHKDIPNEVEQHLANADYFMNNADAESHKLSIEPKEELTMQTEHAMIKITNPIFVNGQDTKGMSDDQILSLVSNAKKGIKSLEELDVKSISVTAKIKELNEGIDGLIKVLDAR